MTGKTFRRIGGSVVVAAALAAAAASPASAMIAPACSTRLAAADTGTTASCSFNTQWDYATIAVANVQGSLTVTLNCVTTYGSQYTWTRTVSRNTTWTSWTPNNCSLTLTSQAPLTTANASATPTLPPIIGPCDPAACTIP